MKRVFIPETILLENKRMNLNSCGFLRKESFLDDDVIAGNNPKDEGVMCFDYSKEINLI